MRRLVRIANHVFTRAEAAPDARRYRLGKRRVRRAPGNMARQRREQRTDIAGADNDPLGRDGGGTDVQECPVSRERRLHDRRTFVDLSTPCVGCRSQSERHPVRIDDRGISRPQRGTRREPSQCANVLGRERRALEPGVAAQFVFAGELRHLLGRLCDDETRARLEVTLDLETPQQRLKVERRPTPRLVRVACGTAAHRLVEKGKGDGGSSVIHPIDAPLSARPIRSASNSATFRPAAAHA